jgi:hypothetical protein
MITSVLSASEEPQLGTFAANLDLPLQSPAALVQLIRRNKVPCVHFRSVSGSPVPKAARTSIGLPLRTLSIVSRSV